MDTATVERLAREAGLHADIDEELPPWWAMERRAYTFAAAVRRETLEEAAKVCESRYTGDNNREDREAKRCAAAIRALKP